MKIFIAVVLLFILVDIAIVAYVIYRRYRKKVPDNVKQSIRKSWKKIIQEADYRHAIMDADKLLDYALMNYGFKGNLGNKLKKSGHMFSNVNQVWAAHKIRNNLAHQIGYEIDKRLYKTTMLAFKQAFKDLKIF